MATVPIAKRVTDLEDLMAQLIRAQLQTTREMRAFKDEMREESRRMNRRWGELSNKLGTMAEDIVAPSVSRILSQLVGCADSVDRSVRVRRHHPEDRGRSQEFDVVASCETHVLVVETRSRLRPADIEDFLAMMRDARSFFPEHGTRKLIGALARLDAEESLVRAATKAGLAVLGLGEELMEVKSPPGFKPREF